VAPPFKVAEFDIIYGKGISKTTEIIDLAMEMGIVERSGAWFYYEGNRIGQGKEAAKKYIEENAELMKELENKLKNMKDQIDIKEEPMILSDEDEDEGEYDISLLGLSD
jgi:recombination protein RecA